MLFYFWLEQLFIEFHHKVKRMFASLSVLYRYLTVILWIGVAYWAAQASWQWFTPEGNYQLHWYTSPVSAQQNAVTADFEQLTGLHLFGQEQEQQAQIQQDAPVTQLNFKLVGVTASSRPLLSAAIIQQNTNQQTYVVGDTLFKTKVNIEQIEHDRIILNNQGRLETLWLEDRDGYEAPLSVNTELLQQERSEELLTFLDIVSITPERRGGRQEGIRVIPKQDKQRFEQLGLQSGDVITEINNIPLTGFQQIEDVLLQLQHVTQVQLKVRRRGELIDLDIAIPE